MVAPSALAETVTPPSFSPVADVIEPLSSASAACAEIGTRAVAANPAAAIAASVKPFACRMSSSPFGVLIRSARDRRGRGRRWHGFQIRNDGTDLGGLELKLEARHPRRPIADDLAHDVLLTVERVLRQDRTILSAGDLRLGVT